MKVTIVQTSLVWENPEANLEHFDRVLDEISDTNLVILPEMFTTGFSMNPANLAAHSTKGVAWMQEKADKLQALMIGSLITQSDDGRFYNRLVAAFPDGSLQFYDKRHLFRMGGEEKVYSAGEKRLQFEYLGWQICPMVCYDLRFPVWSRNTLPNNGYDLLVYVANWPARRAEHWRKLLMARAIENQCFVAGVNRCGDDGKGVAHSGNSGLIDFNGDFLTEIINGSGFQTVDLNLESLKDYREKFPAWMDADAFALK